MPRHDPHRTGVSGGISNITSPEPYWRFFQGGSIQSSNVTVVDCDADGVPDVVMVFGGRAVAKRAADNSVIWQSPLIGAETLVGVRDLDGDGVAEIVVRSSGRVFVLRTSDGSVLWAEPDGEMGTVSAVRVADLDGDGNPEIAIHECGCCSVNSGIPGVVYAFASGASSPTKLYTLPQSACGGAYVFTVANAGVTPGVQLLHGTQSSIELLDGGSGAVLGTTGDLGTYVQTSRCVPGDIDGDGRDEFACVLSVALGAPGNGRRIFLLRVAAGGALQVPWQATVGQVDGGLDDAPDMLRDLDADGRYEITVSGQSAPGVWSTYVYDADTGAELANLPGYHIEGTAPVLAGGRSLVITESNGDLHAFTFDRAALPHAAPAWSLPNRTLLVQSDPTRGVRSWFDQRLVTLDLDGDGVDELITRARDSGADVSAYSCKTGTPLQLAHYDLPAGQGSLGAWVFPPVLTAQPGLAVAHSDGALRFFDASLQPVGSKPVRFGGYYSLGSFRLLRREPVVGALGDGSSGVLVPESRGALVRLDTTQGTFASGPQVVWSRFHTNNPSIVAGLASGKPGILAIEPQDAEHDAVVALDADGGVLWSRDVGGITLSDLVSGHVDSDGVPDVFVEWGESQNFIDQWSALSGTNGSPLWTSAPFGPFARQPAGGAVADWDGDGVEDVVYQADSTRVISGANGQEMMNGEPGYAYFMPTLFDANGDGVLEPTLHCGYAPTRTLSHDLQSELWAGQEDDRPYLYGSVLSCPSAPRLISGSWQFPARLKWTELSGPNAGNTSVAWLAGGSAYASEDDAKQSGATLGQLASPAVHLNLAGDGVPVAVLGSSDGWLYGLDACTGALLFAKDFEAPVGTVIFGDSDGDGLDELIVSVGDGYLYGLKQSPLPSPANVIDTDPPNGFVTQDVDDISTASTLYGAWDPVPGADSYEVAVAADPDEGGGYLTTPPWTTVVGVTSAELTGLPLQDGHRYFFAVRALKAGVPSPDALSDGVVVHLVSEPPPPPASGSEFDDDILNGRACLCALTGRRSASVWALAWFAMGALGLGLRIRSRLRRAV